jgi:hypothetical protein
MEFREATGLTQEHTATKKTHVTASKSSELRPFTACGNTMLLHPIKIALCYWGQCRRHQSENTQKPLLEISLGAKNMVHIYNGILLLIIIQPQRRNKIMSFCRNMGRTRDHVK